MSRTCQTQPSCLGQKKAVISANSVYFIYQMKSLQQDYNSFLCSSLLALSSSVFLMRHDRKHLQALCGLCHKAVPSQGDLWVPRMDRGQALPKKKHPLARASSTTAALLEPQIYCTNICWCSEYSGKITMRRRVENINYWRVHSAIPAATCQVAYVCKSAVLCSLV